MNSESQLNVELLYPYSVDEDDGSYFLTFPDLPGCMTQVERVEEIPGAAREIMELWLETSDHTARLQSPSDWDGCRRFRSNPAIRHRDN